MEEKNKFFLSGKIHSVFPVSISSRCLSPDFIVFQDMLNGILLIANVDHGTALFSLALLLFFFFFLFLVLYMLVIMRTLLKLEPLFQRENLQWTWLGSSLFSLPAQI